MAKAHFRDMGPCIDSFFLKVNRIFKLILKIFMRGVDNIFLSFIQNIGML